MIERATLDPDALAKLFTPDGPVAVCDASGTVRGYFMPVAGGVVPFSEADLDRWEAEPGGKPLSAILAKLTVDE